MRESSIEAYFVREVRRAKGEQRKFVSPGRRGVNDRLAFWPGARCDFVELKRPGKTAEKHQAREHARMRRLGFKTYVIDSKDKVNQYIRGELPCSI